MPEEIEGDLTETVFSAPDPDGMRAGWAALREAWAAMVDRARRLPDEDLHASVDGEWSFVQTLRHLLFGTDKWFAVPILGQAGFHPLGLPNSGSADFPWPGLDDDASPSLAEVLAARADQTTRLGDYLSSLTEGDLTRTVDVLENGPHLVRDCISTVLEEEYWHLGYADRDLAHLEAHR
ncbi:MAG: DinB family protein [Ilumatobacteraceae bacterium]